MSPTPMLCVSYEALRVELKICIWLRGTSRTGDRKKKWLLGLFLWHAKYCTKISVIGTKITQIVVGELCMLEKHEWMVYQSCWPSLESAKPIIHNSFVSSNLMRRMCFVSTYTYDISTHSNRSASLISIYLVYWVFFDNRTIFLLPSGRAYQSMKLASGWQS